MVWLLCRKLLDFVQFIMFLLFQVLPNCPWFRVSNPKYVNAVPIEADSACIQVEQKAHSTIAINA